MLSMNDRCSPYMISQRHEQAKLTVRSAYAYGSRGAHDIPADATLEYRLELLVWRQDFMRGRKEDDPDVRLEVGLSAPPQPHAPRISLSRPFLPPCSNLAPLTCPPQPHTTRLPLPLSSPLPIPKHLFTLNLNLAPHDGTGGRVLERARYKVLQS